MNIQKQQNKKAFSLIEILIILVIVSVSVLAAVPITTNKTSFSTWKRDTYTAGNTEFVAYGHDGSGNDRVGIGSDPYAEQTKGKLSTNYMGVTFNNTDYNKFIFGGKNGSDCAGSQKFFYDGQNLICAPNGNNDNIWGNNNNHDADDNVTGLIIGRNYRDADNPPNHNDATIISSFVNPLATAISGTCIGNVRATNCDAAGKYSFNDRILIDGVGTLFNDAAGVTQITVNANGVTTASPITIQGELYALSYLYVGAACPVNPCRGPYVYETTINNNAENLLPHKKYVENNNVLSITDRSLVNTGNYTYYDNTAQGALPIAIGENYKAIEDAILYSSPAPTDDVDASDIRLKNVLKPYTKGIDYISKVKTYYYTFKNDVEKKLHAGIIAQEIIGIFDEALEKTKDGFYSYKKSPFLYAMVNSVKSLHVEQQDILKEQEELLKMVNNKV